MSKRRLERHVPAAFFFDTPVLTLGNVDTAVKERIVDTLEFDSPVLILINKEWNLFMKNDQDESWDARFKRWYLSHIPTTDLAYINYHDRDKHINMNEVLHKYTITYWLKESKSFSIIHSRPKSDPLRYKGLMSPTGFIDFVWDPFNEDEVLAKMRKSRYPNPKYIGMSDEQIKAQWEKTRSEAADLGTAMHLNLEDYYNKRPYDNTTKEFALFEVHEKRFLKDELIEWRTEQRIFDLSLMFSGSVDMVFIYKDPLKRYNSKGQLIIFIYDWKRSKEIKETNRWQKGNCWLTEKVDDCNLQHYFMQLRIYQTIYERCYNYEVASLNLLVLHPNQNEPLHIKVPLSNLEKARIIRYRKSLLEN